MGGSDGVPDEVLVRNGGGSSLLGSARLKGGRDPLEVFKGEPAELPELNDSECLSEGRECSLASVDLRDANEGTGESDPFVVSIG